MGKNINLHLNKDQIINSCKKYNCRENDLPKILKNVVISEEKVEDFREPSSDELELKKEIEELKFKIDYYQKYTNQTIFEKIQAGVDNMNNDEIGIALGIYKNGINKDKKIIQNGRYGGNNMVALMDTFRIPIENGLIDKMEEFMVLFLSKLQKEYMVIRYHKLRELEIINDNKLADNFDMALEEFKELQVESDKIWMKIEYLFEVKDKENYIVKRKGKRKSVFEYTKQTIIDAYKKYGGHNGLKVAIKQGLIQ